jgi:SRSO17 transposase
MQLQDFQALLPAFTAFLRPFLACFPNRNSQQHFQTYCRGLLSTQPRKSVEPIALAGGPAVRTLQVFLADRPWDEDRLRTLMQQHVLRTLEATSGDDLGTIGLIDETSCRKWGNQTPGVQRQYLGCEGKIENGIVTVHFAVAKGTYSALLDGDLYLPKSWADDRQRCRQAGIPDEVPFRSKWRIAFDQWVRLRQVGHTFDWLSFDEGYGSKVPFLSLLTMMGQRYIGEVPTNFRVRLRCSNSSREARTLWSRTALMRGTRIQVTHQTVADSVWRVVERRVLVNGDAMRVIAAIKESNGETKYFVSNDLDTPLSKLFAVAMRRWQIENSFRLAKQEAGLMDYEGRKYRGLMRHLTLCLVVLAFVVEATESLRGEKSTGDGGAGVPEAERWLQPSAAPPHGPELERTDRHRDPVPSAA